MEQYHKQEISEVTPTQEDVGKLPLENRVKEAKAVQDKSEAEQFAANDKQTPLQGFEKSGIMSNDSATKYLNDRLPPEHLSRNRITEIQYTDQYDGDHDGVTLGMCRTDRVTKVSDIEINRQTPQGSHDRDLMEETMVHEVGHNVYYNMGEQNIASWDQLSANSKPEEYVSNYARTNVREDFAESYAAYVRDPQLLQEVSPQKYSFMQQQVFGGREYGN